jgi:hypothetical protein
MRLRLKKAVDVAPVNCLTDPLQNRKSYERNCASDSNRDINLRLYEFKFYIMVWFEVGNKIFESNCARLHYADIYIKEV